MSQSVERPTLSFGLGNDLGRGIKLCIGLCAQWRVGLIFSLPLPSLSHSLKSMYLNVYVYTYTYILQGSLRNERSTELDVY